MNTLTVPGNNMLTALLESYNELRRLQDQLRTLHLRLEDARRYVAMPGSNPHLGQAQVERMRARYSATLTGLRLARREAHRRLGLPAPTDHQHVA